MTSQCVVAVTSHCGFGCNYCINSEHLNKSEDIDVKGLGKSLESLPGQWEVILSGGEPLRHKDFPFLFEIVTQRHLVVLLSSLWPLEQAEVLLSKPQSVKLINVSVHIERREKSGKIPEFIDLIKRLISKGIEVWPNYVLHPTLLKRFHKDRDDFEKEGIVLHPIPFQGMFEGQMYPQAYADKEKAYFNGVNLPWKSKGVPCNAGKNFFVVDWDGSIRRCYAGKVNIGHVGTPVSLCETAQPCEAEICYCFGDRLIDLSNEERKLREI